MTTIHRIMRRRLRRLAHWWAAGPPLPFFFEHKRHRFSVREQERKNLALIRQRFQNQSIPRVEALFLHIPKCAGTSINQGLVSDAGFQRLDEIWAGKSPRLTGVGRLISPHYNIDWLVKNGVLESKLIDEAYTFTVVRNPFLRAISLFKYLRGTDVVSRNWSLVSFLRHVKRENPSNGGCKVARLSQAAPQVHWVRQSYWRGFDDVFSLEELPTWINLLEHRFGAGIQIPRLNTSPETNVALSRTATDLILEIYAEDFDFFGFNPAPPWHLVQQ